MADGAERQVNLPSKVRESLTSTLKGCHEDAPATLFDVASEEVFKLMERDTFARFKNNPDAIKSLVDAYYSSVDKEARVLGAVSFENFKTWARGEPSVGVLFAGISASINSLLQQQTAVSATNGAADVPADDSTKC